MARPAKRFAAPSLQHSASLQHWFYASDAGGNVTALLDTGNRLAARHHYDPFGNLLGLSGPMADANLYRFSSKEFHANSSLYYYGFRFYDPNLQRWINRDPIGEAGAINLYQFVYGNPMRYVDPYGETGSEAADWLDDQLERLCDELTGDSTSWVLIGLVNTGCGLASGVAEPLRLGETAGALSACDATAGEIAMGVLDEASRAAALAGGVMAGTGKVCQLIKAAETGGQGLSSFSSFKRALCPAGENAQWHHIVEQTPGNLERFGAQTIHNTENLVPVPTGIHRQISGFYSSKQPFTGGQTARQWLSTQPLEAQQQFGRQVMEQFGAPLP